MSEGGGGGVREGGREGGRGRWKEGGYVPQVPQQWLVGYQGSCRL